MNRKPRIIGITGGIAAGKSMICQQLAQRGIAIIDTDAISRSLTASGGRAIKAIREHFGDVAITKDGSMNRPFMRELVFKSEQAKRQLESLLHPMIRDDAEQQIRAHQAQASAPYIILDIPLLAEHAYWRTLLDNIVVIDCSPTRQRQRLLQRPGMTPELADRILAQQASREARLAIADHIIDNDHDDPEKTHQAVIQLDILLREPNRAISLRPSARD